MAWFTEILDTVLPEGTRLEKARIASGAWRLLLTVFMLYATGMLAFAGFDGLAKAHDVDTKIKAAIDPIKADLTSIKNAQAENKALLEAILITQITDRLRELERIKCRAPQDQRTLESEIEDAQQRYHILTGDRYPLPTCEQP